MTDLHLDAEHPLGLIRLEGRHDLGGAHVEPAAVGVIDRRALPAAAQELVDRHLGNLSLDIPEGQVNRRLSLDSQAAPAARLKSLVKPVPQAFMVEGVLVDQERCKIVLEDAAGCRVAPQQAPGVSDARRPVFGGDEDNRHVDLVDRASLLAGGVGRLHRARQRHAQQLGPDFGNLHDGHFSFNVIACLFLPPQGTDVPFSPEPTNPERMEPLPQDETFSAPRPNRTGSRL